MTAKQKSGLPVIRIFLGALLLVAVGVTVDIDWEALARQISEERHRGKKVCFRITNTPKQRVSVAWHIGRSGDTFEGLIKHWDRCEPAETGETFGLVVDKTLSGNTTCRVRQLPEGNEVREVKGDREPCSVEGVVL